MRIQNLIFSIFIALGLGMPVYAYEWSAVTRLSLTEEYNDNIYQDSDNEEDDFITIVTPGIKTNLDWQRYGFSAAYDLGYSFYKDHSENDGFRHRGDVAGWWNVARNTRLTAGDIYIRSEDITELPTNDNGADRREGYYSNSAFVGLDHRFGENRNLAIKYVYGILDNDDRTIEDNESHSTTLDTTYFFDPFLGINVNAGYTRGLYDTSQDYDEWKGTLRVLRNLSRHVQLNAAYSHTSMTWDSPGDENDYQVYNPSAGIKYTFDEDGAMGLNLGYFIQDIDSRDNEKGLTVDGNIGRSWRFRGGAFSLNATSGYENSQLNTENLGFNVYYGVQSRLDYRFTRNLGTAIYAAYRNVDYVNPGPLEDERKDDYVDAGCSLNWQIRKWLGTGLEYSYRNLDSNIDDNDYTVNRIMLKVVLSSQFGKSRGSGENEGI